MAAAFDRGVLGAAAELLGLSRAMLEITVEYTGQRHQFGKPIGSFQAVKHHLANARLGIEFAAPAVLYAAYAIAHGQPDASRSRVAGQVAGRERSRGHRPGRPPVPRRHRLHVRARSASLPQALLGP